MNYLASYAGFSVGEQVRYLVGFRSNLLATIGNIESYPLSNKCFIFKLVFNEPLPPHLKEQPVTAPQNLDWFEKITEVEF